MKVARFEFSMFGINTYVVYDPATRKAAIIDPGMSNRREEDAIVNFIEREKLEVTHIINTHLHIDHAIGDKSSAETFKSPIYAHQGDEILGSRLQQQAVMFGLEEKVDRISINSYLHDGDEIRIGEGVLKVIHVPGHSPGGIALYDAADGFVIAGDSLFAGSIGRTDLPGGDYKTLIDSVKEKLLSLPEDTKVYSGHGGSTTIGIEKRSNPFLN